MDICKDTKWLCENTRRLEKFSGRWVTFSTEENDVHCADSLENLLRSSAARRAASVPFVFHVPSKEDLRTPLPFVKKK